MDYAKQQRDPTKHVIGLAFVVLMHVLVIYALFTGLGRSMMQIIKKPMSATIIEEIKPPPPPPPPPPKKIETPPPPPPKVETFVPPPDNPVTTESTGPTITLTKPEPPPPAPVVVAPPPPPPPPPPKPAIRKGIVRLSGEDPIYPRQAIRAGVEKGQVLARVMIDEKGNVTDVIIVSSQPPKVFDSAVIDALKEWKFKAEGEKYVGEIEINFKLQ
jgi:protein TonB